MLVLKSDWFSSNWLDYHLASLFDKYFEFLLVAFGPDNSRALLGLEVLG